MNKTLSIDGSTGFSPIGYFLFMPASKIGIGASFFLTGNTVINPVASGDLDTSHNLTSPTGWVLKDPMTWINEPGCSGLLAVANQVVANNSGATLLSVATYFESYFAKFYAAESTMFSWFDGVLRGGNISSSLVIIAMDDLPNGPGTTPVPLQLNANSTVNLVWNAANTTYSLDNGILDLQGQPPIRFTTSISN